jgi:hypothetical protein
MTVTAPTIQTKTPTPANGATGIEEFDDLPPQTDEGEEISTTSGDAVEDEGGFIDFESLLTRGVSEVPAAPAEGTPQVGDTTVAPVTTAPAPATPIATPQPVVAAQPVVAPVPGQAPTAPQAAPVTTPQQAPQAPVPTSVANPEQVLQQLQQGVEQTRTQLVQHVADHYEKLISDEDVELLQTEPKKALAALAGKIHVDGLSNILSVLSSNLPTMVHGMMEGMQKNQKATDEFYGKYTMFDRSQHGEAIINLAKALRQANPQLDAQTFESMLAATAMAHLRLQPQAPQARAPAAAQPRAPRGFAPANGGQPSAPQSNPHANNPWAAFVEASMND